MQVVLLLLSPLPSQFVSSASIVCSTKGLVFVASPDLLVGLGGPQPPWPIKPGIKVSLPVPSWLLALRGRFGGPSGEPPLLQGKTLGAAGGVLAAPCCLLLFLFLRCLVFLPGGSSEPVSEHCRLREEQEGGRS